MCHGVILAAIVTVLARVIEIKGGMSKKQLKRIQQQFYNESNTNSTKTSKYNKYFLFLFFIFLNTTNTAMKMQYNSGGRDRGAGVRRIRELRT